MSLLVVMFVAIFVETDPVFLSLALHLDKQTDMPIGNPFRAQGTSERIIQKKKTENTLFLFLLVL